MKYLAYSILFSDLRFGPVIPFITFNDRNLIVLHSFLLTLPAVIDATVQS